MCNRVAHSLSQPRPGDSQQLVSVFPYFLCFSHNVPWSRMSGVAMRLTPGNGFFFSNFKVAGSQTLKESGKPVKVAESDVDVSKKRDTRMKMTKL